ncbi:MAG TPA: zf-HC2 domain-containing protein [Streptosporangiaceae bacterium]|nr:zf-HC2 domain-containing protein [Streptosporangiaceae bacterium]
MEPPAAHAEVAAFVLGVLDEEENEIFEAHLADCADCQAELRELYIMPPILDEVARIDQAAARAPEPEPAPAMLAGLLDDVVEVRRRRRRGVYLTAAAAAAVIAVTPLATHWLWPAAPDDQRGRTVAAASAAPAGTEVLQASNRATAVTAKITIEPKAWGTHVGFELYGVRGPLHCQLVVVTRSGKSEVVTSWRVPDKQGWGVPGSPNPLRLEGNTGFFRADIDRFEFRTSTGPNILNVPA